MDMEFEASAATAAEGRETVGLLDKSSTSSSARPPQDKAGMKMQVVEQEYTKYDGREETKKRDSMASKKSTTSTIMSKKKVNQQRAMSEQFAMAANKEAIEDAYGSGGMMDSSPAKSSVRGSIVSRKRRNEDASSKTGMCNGKKCIIF